MAGLGRWLGQTKPGYWLWSRARGPTGRRIIAALSQMATQLGWIVQRRLPRHQRHDAAQRAILAAFDATPRRDPP